MVGTRSQRQPRRLIGGACCARCANKKPDTEPKGNCSAWSFNHPSKTCWMKTSKGTKPNHNGDTSGVVTGAARPPPVCGTMVHTDLDCHNCEEPFHSLLSCPQPGPRLH